MIFVERVSNEEFVITFRENLSNFNYQNIEDQFLIWFDQNLLDQNVHYTTKAVSTDKIKLKLLMKSPSYNSRLKVELKTYDIPLHDQ